MTHQTSTSRLAPFFLTLILALGSLGIATAQLSISIDQELPTCAGYTDGFIIAEASGGERPYSYLWSDGSTERARYDLDDPGTYTVTVTDDAGATASESVTVVTPDPVVLTIEIVGDPCDGTDVDYELVATGGVPPYTFFWDGDPVSSTIDDPEVGYHKAKAMDANGCFGWADIKTREALSVSVRAENPECAGFGAHGVLKADVTGGNGPFTFLWSNGSTEQQPAGLLPGTYDVTVTDEDGCTATASGTLVEPDPITITVSLADSCSGGTIATAAATGGTGTLTYRWSNGERGTSAFLPEGQWYINVEDANGCESTERVIVSDGIAEISTMNTDATCDEGGTSLLCITGGRGPFTYIWSDGQDSIMAVDLAPGTYTYIAIDGGGCEFRGSTVINGPDPSECDDCDADAGSLVGGVTTDSVCSPVTLTAAAMMPPTIPAGYTTLYVLTTGPNATIVDVGVSPTFTVDQPGSYTIHTLIYDPATLDLSGVVLGQTTAASIFLQIVPGGGDICADLDLTGTTFVVPPCPDPAGCVVSGSAPSLASNPVCFDGTSATLSPDVITAGSVPAGFALVYLLVEQPGGIIIASRPTADFDVTAAGTYAITSIVYNTDSLDLASVLTVGTTTFAELGVVTTECDDLGNLGAAFDVVLFNPAFASGLTDTPCAGEPTTLNADANPAFTYVWTPAVGLDDPNSPSPVATLDESQTYTVTISQEISGVLCSVDRTYTVDIAEQPTLSTTDDVVACTNDDVELSVQTQAGNTVEWSRTADFAAIAQTGETFEVTPGDATTYFVRSVSPEGCVTTDEITVTNETVDFRAGDDMTICSGDPAEIQTTVFTGNPTNYSLIDEDGEVVEDSSDGTFTFNPSESQRYQVIATNDAGCADTTFVSVDVNDVMVDLSTDSVAIYPGNEIVLTAVGQGVGTYEFVQDSSLTSVDDDVATAMPSVTTRYEVVAMDSFGCTATDTATVIVREFECDRPFLFVPNAFTPNNDGVNDVFFVDGVNIRSGYYAIYNRWGEKVYETTIIGPEAGWDGTFNGELVDPDVYGIYVRIECRDDDDFYEQGNVTVIR